MPEEVIPRLVAHLAAVAVLCSLTACAAVAPPIDAPKEDENGLRLIPLSASPDGLEFHLSAPEAAVGDELEIWRRSSDGAWTKLQTISVEPQLGTALRDGRAQWRDPLDNRSRSLDYRLIHRGEDVVDETSLDIDWRGWPDITAPTSTTVDEPAPHVVLTWRDAAGFEARILRRDVLEETDFEPIAIVASAAGGAFEDHDVEPDGVYAYRIQYVDRQAPIPRFSRYTESIYVSIPPR